jgi:tyrosyl-tRNA synthetase
MTAIDLLLKASFASSKSEAKRLIKAGGARINDQKVTDDSTLISQTDFIDGKLKLSSGKKTHCVIVLK